VPDKNTAGRLRAKDGRRQKGNEREHHMAISRRDVLLGGAGALGAASFSFPAPAIAQSDSIKIGCLAAMTGPSSAPTIGFNRGVDFAVKAINAAGGVKGRKIEIVMRDTQGDPTKAVNATQEMISQVKVHGIWGPLNSGGRSRPRRSWRAPRCRTSILAWSKP
jgi:branched-chain amino acid transport system substrate-binding protein